MKKIKIVLKKQNDKTNQIYEEIVEIDENIIELDLSYKELIEIPKGLEQLKFLKELYLQDNKITKIENLDKNINLIKLNLNNNKITKIENLNNNIDLTYLDLYDNQISKIENLDNNINLKNLYLDKNQITKIENIHHLDKLKSFWLFSNQNENIEECKQISFDNYNLEQKEIQIQKEIKEELLKLEKQRQEKEYFDNNFDKIKQQFIISNHQNNDLLI